MAQYLGQRMEAPTDYNPRLIGVYTHPDNYVGAPLNIHSRTWYQVKDCCLLLRTVDMLILDEITAIGLYIGWGISEENKTTVLPWVIKDLNGNIQNAFYKEIFRCYGILTSFTYLNEQNQPVTLTPAQLIEMGWCKIKAS